MMEEKNNLYDVFDLNKNDRLNDGFVDSKRRIHLMIR